MVSCRLIVSLVLRSCHGLSYTSLLVAQVTLFGILLRISHPSASPADGASSHLLSISDCQHIVRRLGSGSLCLGIRQAGTSVVKNQRVTKSGVDMTHQVSGGGSSTTEESRSQVSGRNTRVTRLGKRREEFPIHNGPLAPALWTLQNSGCASLGLHFLDRNGPFDSFGSPIRKNAHKMNPFFMVFTTLWGRKTWQAENTKIISNMHVVSSMCFRDVASFVE